MSLPRRLRDLLVLPLDGQECLVISCDAAGGVGPKPADSVACPASIVGRLTARVALMELVAAGARPIALVCAACVEPSPTGAQLLAGVLEEAALVGLPPAAITGSSEKNLPTQQTALGVTAIGRAALGSLRPGRACPGDLVVVIGRPKVGAAVQLDDPELADLPLLQQLAAVAAVHDILPVGSRGIAAELADLAAGAALRPISLPAAAFPAGRPQARLELLDLNASAGPATCVLAAMPPAAYAALAAQWRQPHLPIAQLFPLNEETG